MLLLHYNGSTRAWERVAELDERGSGGVASFSPFAVGYADTAPSFAEDPEAYVWDVDEEIEPVTLPTAKGGDRVEYALSPALPEGVVERDGRLSGTPTEEMGVTDYTWTATDVLDDQFAKWEFTIEVVPALDKARERLATLNQSVLPELSRATWGSVLEAVTGRLESSGAGGGMTDTLASALKARERAQDGDGVSWREVVEGRTFAVALGGGSGGSGGTGIGSGGGGAVMWGGGSRRSLALDKGPLDWSGDLFAAHVGIDAPLGGGLRGSLAASWIEGKVEYTDRSGDAAVAGVHESRLAAVRRVDGTGRLAPVGRAGLRRRRDRGQGVRGAVRDTEGRQRVRGRRGGRLGSGGVGERAGGVGEGLGGGDAVFGGGQRLGARGGVGGHAAGAALGGGAADVGAGERRVGDAVA